jgi:hypothetical protein
LLHLEVGPCGERFDERRARAVVFGRHDDTSRESVVRTEIVLCIEEAREPIRPLGRLQLADSRSEITSAMAPIDYAAPADHASSSNVYSSMDWMKYSS